MSFQALKLAKLRWIVVLFVGICVHILWVLFHLGVGGVRWELFRNSPGYNISTPLSTE